jgi:tripartite-type tricarboxylate transporter receptor subunit TctC
MMIQEFQVCYIVVARAAPDGYTLLVASAAHAVNGGTRKLPYDPVKSFEWAGTLGLGPSVLSVNATLPVTTLKELLAHGKANPGKLVMASSGGCAHFSTELFHHLSGMKLIVVIRARPQAAGNREALRSGRRGSGYPHAR